MNAVILAAGRSSRLRPLTDNLPKCLLEVAGVPILKRAIARLQEAGFRRFVIVTGYLEEQIRAAVTEWFPDANIELVTNERWETTNNCYSLLLAAEALGGQGYLLIDGDVVFERSVVDAVVRSDRPDLFVLRRADELGDEEMKVELDDQGRVRIISKEILPERAAGESVGIFSFSAGAAAISANLDDRIRGQGLENEWYEASFQQAIVRGLSLYPVYAEGYVAEIDTPEDLAEVDRAVREREV